MGGTGLNCTKIKLHEVTKLHDGTKLHESTKLHEAKFARGHKIARRNKIARRRFCTKFNFARVTFLHESKKNLSKNINKTQIFRTIYISCLFRQLYTNT